MISPAQVYAKEAAKNLVTQFINEFQKIHQQEEQLINSIQEINQVILKDRQSFLDAFGQQNDLNQSIITNVKELVDLVRDNNQKHQDNLQQASMGITNELRNAANSLEEKVISLEKSSSKIAQLNQLQAHLEKIVEVLNSVDQMQDNLSGIKDKISLLEPTLQDLSKPKVIRLVEQIEQ